MRIRERDAPGNESLLASRAPARVSTSPTAAIAAAPTSSSSRGTLAGIASVVDGALLVDAWPDLILPTELRQAWQNLIDRTHTKLAETS